MNDLRISIIQSALFWEDSHKNLAQFEQKIAAIQAPTDLIVLPEMFNTGFTMNSANVAQDMNGQAVNWMKEMAALKKASIVGSLVIKEANNYFNRLVYVDPMGNIEHYDKRHLFRMAGEHQFFSAGKEKKIIRLGGWNINLQVCYDLRFPVWSRNQFRKMQNEALSAYDVLIYVANWPSARINAWDVLLQARAIENQCYVVGVNRVGRDGNDIGYNGHSKWIDPKGNILLETEEGREHTATVSFLYDELTDFRKRFPVGLDAD